MKTKIKIESVFGKLLFELEKEDNNIRKTLEAAVEDCANLRGANLRGANLYDANLRGADLRGADLRGANLYDADLYGANLYDADLRGANLRGADLYGANLRGANLYDANLRGANLYDADLRGANLYDADLYGANLYDANLRGADLRGAKGIPYITMNCPSDGTFTAWKKVDNKLIKLLIPEDAKRSSAMTMKCRCDKAKVLAITSLDEEKSFDEVVNVGYIPHITYKVGEIVYPDKFDEDRWNECSNGIHFFINKQDAINY